MNKVKKVSGDYTKAVKDLERKGYIIKEIEEVSSIMLSNKLYYIHYEIPKKCKCDYCHGTNCKTKVFKYPYIRIEVCQNCLNLKNERNLNWIQLNKLVNPWDGTERR